MDNLSGATHFAMSSGSNNWGIPKASSAILNARKLFLERKKLKFIFQYKILCLKHNYFNFNLKRPV